MTPMVGGQVDAQQFPALSEYLAQLPQGIASYPAASTMGIILKSAVAEHYFHASWKRLPAVLVAALKRPPLPTSWVSTVMTDAVFCLIADTFYPTDEAVLKWSYERTARLTRVPMYAPITRFAGVERFVKAGARVHGLFQRGTDLDVEASPGRAELALRHPPHLHGRLNHLSNEGVFRAALEAAGPGDATVELVESAPSVARYVARWR